jgi:cyclase
VTYRGKKVEHIGELTPTEIYRGSVRRVRRSCGATEWAFLPSRCSSPTSPADALPQQTFSTSQKLQANGEIVMLQYFQPAHTDTDIYIHFQKANVIHMGDTFFNGFYPVIDASTGGKIDGMIVAADKVLPLADNNTKIVPGHGPLGNKADLTKFRDMLVVARDRVQKLKTAGKSADEIAASKPFADLDATWGKGFFNGDVFVQVVYSTL